MANAFLHLCRTIYILATIGDFTLKTYHLSATNRTFFRKFKFLFLAVAFGFDHFDNLGNHVTGALNHHRVTDHDAEPLDFVFIVQCRAAHGDAADHHRLHDRHRRDRARAPHLRLNLENLRRFLLRFILVGYGPARAARAHAGVALLLK
ncbi:MAG: hypothetical protein ALAOOOJD_01587 [bacterium]|nr:hypothetical protein [bacterium]